MVYSSTDIKISKSGYTGHLNKLVTDIPRDHLQHIVGHIFVVDTTGTKNKIYWGMMHLNLESILQDKQEWFERN